MVKLSNSGSRVFLLFTFAFILVFTSSYTRDNPDHSIPNSAILKILFLHSERADKPFSITFNEVLKTELNKTFSEANEIESQYLYERSELENWNINIEESPPERIILNRKYSFFELYWWQIIVIILILLIQSLLIFYLKLSVQKRKKIQEELSKHKTHLDELVKERTQELELNKTKLQLITDSVPALIAFINTDYRYEFANAYYQELLHLEPSKIIGSTIKEVIGEEAFAAVKSRYDAVFRDERQEYETAFALPDGRIGHFLAAYIPQKIDGEVVGCFALVQDITKRINAEEKLRQAKDEVDRTNIRLEEAAEISISRFQAFAENIPASVYIINEKLQYIFMNSSTISSLNLEKEEFKGKTCYYIFSSDIAKKLEAADRLVQENEKPTIVEFKVKMPDGNDHWKKDYKFPIKMPDGQLFIGGISFDITNEKFQADKSKEIQNIHQAFMNNFPAAIFIKNSQLEHIYGNKHVLKLFNTTLDKWKGSKSGDWFLIEQAKEREAVDTEVLNGKVILNEEYFAEYDGKTRYWSDVKFPIKGPNNEKLMAGIAIEVTEKRLVEKQLTESELKYRSLFETARDAIFIVDNGRIMDINLAAKKLFGYKNSIELINKSVWDIAPEKQPDGRASKELMISVIESVLAGNSQLINCKHIKNDGVEFDAEVSINRLFYGENKFILATIRDITERKKMLKEIKENEERFNQAFNKHITPMVIVDLNTDKRLVVNNSYIKFLGYDKQQLLNEKISNSRLLKDPKKIQELFELVREQHTVTNFETELITALGEVKDIIAGATYLNKEKKDQVLIYFIDITEQKKYEQNVYTAMVESEEKERGRYANELHDGLGPILSTSMIYLHTLLDEKNPDNQRKHVNRTYALLEEATQSIKEISNNLSPHILKKFGLAQAVRSFIEKLKHVSDIKFIIDSKLKTRLPDIVEITLYRSLIELINNTIKHAKASEIKIGIDYSHDSLNITYKDNGHGFDLAEIKSKRPGFGLSNLENRIKKINGNLDYNSAPGKGVDVNITIKINNK